MLKNRIYEGHVRKGVKGLVPHRHYYCRKMDMEPISIVNPGPIVLRPPALGDPIMNSPEEIASRSAVRIFLEERLIEIQRDAQQTANLSAAIAGRHTNGPIDMAPQGSADIINLIV